MLIINESGLYSLILSSKMPKARPSKRWVTSEVLPAIRKNGALRSFQAQQHIEQLEATYPAERRHSGSRQRKSRAGRRHQLRNDFIKHRDNYKSPSICRPRPITARSATVCGRRKLWQGTSRS